MRQSFDGRFQHFVNYWAWNQFDYHEVLNYVGQLWEFNVPFRQYDIVSDAARIQKRYVSIIITAEKVSKEVAVVWLLSTDDSEAGLERTFWMTDDFILLFVLLHFLPNISFKLFIYFIGRGVWNLLNLATEVVIFAEIKLLIVLVLYIFCFLCNFFGFVLRHPFVYLNDADLMEIAAAFYYWSFLDRSVHHHMIMSAQNHINISWSLCQVKIIAISHMSQSDYKVTFLFAF